VTVLSLQCFDTVHWLTARTSSWNESPPAVPSGSSLRGPRLTWSDRNKLLKAGI